MHARVPHSSDSAFSCQAISFIAKFSPYTACTCAYHYGALLALLVHGTYMCNECDPWCAWLTIGTDLDYQMLYT